MPRPAVFVGIALAAAAVARASQDNFREALERPYHGYCATPPGAQRRSVVGPPPAAALAAAGLELVAAQVVFRHGARDMSSDHKCFAPMHESFRRCHIEPIVAFTGVDGRQPSPSLVKEVIDAYPSAQRPGQPGCGRGFLLDGAVPQTRAFAEAFREAYFDRFAGGAPTLNRTRFYSTDKQRTMATLFMLQGFLFQGHGEPETKVFTRPIEGDHWDLNQHCGRVAGSRHSGAYSDGEMAEILYPEFVARWAAAAGTDFEPAFKDCLLVAHCSDHIELPKDLSPGTPLFEETLRVSLRLFQRRYTDDIDGVRLLAAPALLELAEFLTQQATGVGPQLALWATHDTTIIVLLAALGLWDGQWPPYMDSLVVEVYRAAEGAYFRMVHGGKALELPWCAHEQLAMGHGLCPVGQFLPDDIAAYRDPRLLAADCAEPSFLAEPESSSSLAEQGRASEPLAFPIAAVGSLLAGGLGFALGRLRRDGSDAHAARMPLLSGV